jgi:hypothetical protein
MKKIILAIIFFFLLLPNINPAGAYWWERYLKPIPTRKPIHIQMWNITPTIKKTPIPTPKITATPAIVPTTVPTSVPGHILWGAYTGNTLASLTDFETRVGKQVDVNGVFVGWGSNGAFATSIANSLKSQGKTFGLDDH